MSQHLLQSRDWESFQQALGKETMRIDLGDSNCLGIIERAYGRVGRHIKRLYTPYGPTLANEGKLRDAVRAIEDVARSFSVDYLRLEPTGVVNSSALAELGYVKRAKPSQPDTTRVVNVQGKTVDEVVADMNATNRNLWRRNRTEQNVSTSVSYDLRMLDSFDALLRQTTARTGAIFHTKSYFRTMLEVLGSSERCGIMTASTDQPLAAALFAVDIESRTLYYLHAGSSDEARAHNAGNILLAELICYAVDKGLDRVDLFGVSPVDASREHPLYGISNFKRSFGGEDVVYGGTWEKSLSLKHRVLSGFKRAGK